MMFTDISPRDVQLIHFTHFKCVKYFASTLNTRKVVEGTAWSTFTTSFGRTTTLSMLFPKYVIIFPNLCLLCV